MAVAPAVSNKSRARIFGLIVAAIAVIAPVANGQEADCGIARRGLRQGQMVPVRKQRRWEGRLRGIGGYRENSRHQPRRERTARAWKGWHAVAPPMRKRYARMVVLANQGSREMGFADIGAMWRSNYDMTPEQFAARWTGCGSRSARSTFRCTPTCAGSSRRSTAASCREDAPIPAHLLGNMWAQDWTNIYPLVVRRRMPIPVTTCTRS